MAQEPAGPRGHFGCELVHTAHGALGVQVRCQPPPMRRTPARLPAVRERAWLHRRTGGAPRFGSAAAALQIEAAHLGSAAENGEDGLDGEAVPLEQVTASFLAFCQV